jgi:hypothetical protein
MPVSSSKWSRAAQMSSTGSYEPSKVEPRIATTPIVFSSQRATASSADMCRRSPSIGTRRISTSQ